MADTDLNRVFGRLTPGSQWLLSSANPPHTLVEWRGPATQPTQQEIDNEWAVIEAEDAAQAAEDAQMQADYDAALTAWQSIGDWAKTYTDAQVDTWVDTNVTDMASAKTTTAEVVKVLRKVIDILHINYLS